MNFLSLTLSLKYAIISKDISLIRNPKTNRKEKSMSVHIVCAANADVLLQLRLAVDPPRNDADAEKTRKKVQQLVAAKDRAAAFIFLEEDRAVGYIVVNLSLKLHSDAPPLPKLDGYGHISVIGVMREARGKGSAQTLLHEGEKWLKSKGTKGAWLDYLPHLVGGKIRKKGGRHPYHRLGYKDVASFRDTKKNRERRIAVKHW